MEQQQQDNISDTSSETSLPSVKAISRRVSNLLDEIQCMMDLQNYTKVNEMDNYFLNLSNLIQKQLALLHSLIDKRTEIFEQMYNINFE